jgi:hypothetical protein
MERATAPRLMATPRRAAPVVATQAADLGTYLFSYFSFNYFGFYLMSMQHSCNISNFVYQLIFGTPRFFLSNHFT